MGREWGVKEKEGAVSARFPAHRRMVMGIAACLCGLACLLGASEPGTAGAAQFGAFQFGEIGEGAGQLEGPVGVAVNNDSSSLFYGDVYVADPDNHRVDRFGGSGVFQMAWGWGVANGADELQTCAATCRAGEREEPSAPLPVNTGAINYAFGVAVDNDSLSPSAGDVYVVEAGGEDERVEKFGPSGEFLLMFGGDVNETTGANVCNAGEKCQRAKQGPSNGEFEDLAGQASSIAVGPGGSVYVGDRARVQVFEPSGVWRETISLAGLSSTGNVTALAVDAAGDVFVKDSEATGVWEFEPNGVEKATPIDAGSDSVTALAVDGSGDLFIGESSGEIYVHILKYNLTTGKIVGSFGSKTVRGGDGSGLSNELSSAGPFADGIAFSEALGDMYVSEAFYDTSLASNFKNFASVWGLSVPPPGPAIANESTTPEPPGGMILEAIVNPEGNETEYHFEYVTEAAFEANGFAHAVSTPTGSVAAGLEGQSVRAHVAGLPTSTNYYYRVVASNVESVSPAVGHEEVFESLPAASIDEEYVTEVASSSATIDAEVDPLGSSTEYSIEYGTANVSEHVTAGDAGAGTTDLLVSRHVQELSPDATYHYRIVVRNALGTVNGAEGMFTTQSANGSSALIDGRMWELVSPVDKHGALLELNEQGGDVQAASDGSGIAYMAEAGSPSEVTVGKIQRAQILSTRGATGGWSSQDLTLPGELSEDGTTAEHLLHVYPEYHLFSPNLSSAVVEPQEFGTPLLSPEATARTIYLRDDAKASFLPLVTGADVAPGASIEEPDLASVPGADEWQLQFLAATPDLEHVVLSTPMALVPPAVDDENVEEYLEKRQQGMEVRPTENLYEWSNGALQLVNILPGAEGVAHGFSARVTLAGLESQPGYPRGGVQRVISDDGRRVAWTWGEPYGPNGASYKGLYVRDMAEERTVRIGGAHAIYQTMNVEGSKIFYLEDGDLYVYDYETGTATDLTVDHGVSESSGGVQELVSDVSENGLYVYFVAKGVLAEGGVGGADNLYLLHDTGDGWTTKHVATLSSEDQPDWYDLGSATAPFLAGIASRVSPDGRYLAFMSQRPLTGYDNRDAVSGAPDEEVYLYDAQEGKLVCGSCDPTGARPDGVFDEGASELLVDRTSVWTANNTLPGDVHTNHWLAGSIPGWDDLSNEPATYQPRYLSDSGRLFFDSPVGLVPQDTNGLEDVYEYEPEGVGGCTSATSSAVEVYVKEVAGSPVGGCVGLISSGTSSSESAFYDASEDGDDVFFDTTSKLVPEDPDKAYDVYDAHMCSSAVPCRPAPVAPPPCDTGDSCKAAASPQPTIFGTPASATFDGAGNIAPALPVMTVTKKKTMKCAKGKKRRGDKCLKGKARTKKKARRAGGERRARS